MAWNVLHLRPRCEKKVAALCRLQEIPHYLPLRTGSRTYQRRRVTSVTPLFPGYLFADIDPEAKLVLLRSQHIIRLLVPHSDRHLLRQLVQVRRALRATPDLRPVAALTRGRRVRITQGPCQGVEGRIERLKGGKGARLRVVLNVDLIGRAVAVEADASQLEMLD